MINLFNKHTKINTKKIKIEDVVINLQENNISDNKNDILNNGNANDVMKIKKYKYNNSIYGLVHIRLKYFIKMRNYNNYMSKITEKATNAFKISKNNSNSKKIFIFLDLSNITQKNFSTKFIKQLSMKLNNEYKNTLALCFLYGDISFIKIVWPFIKLLLDNDTKQKIVLLD